MMKSDPAPDTISTYGQPVLRIMIKKGKGGSNIPGLEEGKRLKCA